MFKIIKNDLPEIEQAVKDNDGYCPCAIFHEEDVKCPCKEFRTDDTMTNCHCGLYSRIDD